MLDPVPWFVDGGEHSPAVARMLAHAATSGTNGIVFATDLRVLALPVPGTSVNVMPGGAILANKYPGGTGQSYMMRNINATPVEIPATGSAGGATRYLIARIQDPEFGGAAPVDPVAGPYVFFETVPNVDNLPYPHVVLCRIEQPANTGTITNGMIYDMREVANPREKTVTFSRPNVTGDAGVVLTGTQAYPDGEWFPNVGGQFNNGIYYVEIPEWATTMQVRAEWLSVRYAADAGYGYCWVAYGPNSTTNTPLHYTQGFSWDADEGGVPYRTNWIVDDEQPVLAEWRGTTQEFVMRANKIGDSATYPGQVELTSTSGVVFSVRFREVADPNA